jgi:hypothetical protein
MIITNAREIYLHVDRKQEEFLVKLREPEVDEWLRLAALTHGIADSLWDTKFNNERVPWNLYIVFENLRSLLLFGRRKD